MKKSNLLYVNSFLKILLEKLKNLIFYNKHYK